MHDPKTILLAEDEDLFRSMLADLLRFDDYNVLEAGNGDEAVSAADAHSGRIDLVITDINLHGMTGLELASRLRADRWRFPILLITAAPSPAIVTRATPLGIETVLRKPFAESDIVAFVEGLAD